MMRIFISILLLLYPSGLWAHQEYLNEIFRLTQRNIELKNTIDNLHYGVFYALLAGVVVLLLLLLNCIRRYSRTKSSALALPDIAVPPSNQQMQALQHGENKVEMQDMQGDNIFPEKAETAETADDEAETADDEADDAEMIAAIITEDLTDDALIDETMLDRKIQAELYNQPSIVAQHAFPESLNYLRNIRPAGTSEHDLWQWIQDMLLNMPKYGLKNNPTIILPATEDGYSSDDWLEQGLRYFNDNHFSDALRAFFDVHLHATNQDQRIAADFMKMQILFRLELWQDAHDTALQIIVDYDKAHKSTLLDITMATAYMVRTGYAMWFIENDEQARKHIDKALLYANKLDVHDLLMAGVIAHAHLFKVAFFARSNPALSLHAMQAILTIFADTVIPEIQILRDGIKRFF